MEQRLDALITMFRNKGADFCTYSEFARKELARLTAVK